MKKFLALIAAIAVSASAAHAGCGKKVTDAGNLSKYDADTKAIVVKLADGKKAKLTVTPSTEYKGKDGKAVKAEDLVGKDVKVVSEHKKVDSITAS